MCQYFLNKQGYWNLPAVAGWKTEVHCVHQRRSRRWKPRSPVQVVQCLKTVIAIFEEYSLFILLTYFFFLQLKCH